MTIEKVYEKFYKLLEQIDNSDVPQMFLRVTSTNCIRIWNLKLNRKGNKRMQICMNIDKGDFNNGEK